MADSFTFEEALEAPKSFTFEEAGGLSPELQAKKSDLQSQMVSARIEGLQNKAAMTAADIGQRAAYTISLMNPGDLFRKLVNPQGTALVPPEQMKRILYPAGGEFSPGSIEGAIGDFITESASSMTQPDVAAALALGKASPELAGRYFQTQMIQQSPEAVARLAQSKTPAEAVKSGLETAASVGLPLAIEAGLRSPPGPQVPMDTGKVLAMPRGSPAVRRPAFQLPDVAEEVKPTAVEAKSPKAEVAPAPPAEPVVAKAGTGKAEVKEWIPPADFPLSHLEPERIPEVKTEIERRKATVDQADKESEPFWEKVKEAEKKLANAKRSYDDAKIQKAEASVARAKKKWQEKLEVKYKATSLLDDAKDAQWWPSASPFAKWVWRMQREYLDLRDKEGNAEGGRAGPQATKFRNRIIEAIEKRWEEAIQEAGHSPEEARSIRLRRFTLADSVFSDPLNPKNEITKLGEWSSKNFREDNIRDSARKEIDKLDLPRNFREVPIKIEDWDTPEDVARKVEQAKQKAKDYAKSKAEESRKAIESKRKAAEEELQTARRLQSEGKLVWRMSGGDAGKHWTPVSGKAVKIPEAAAANFWMYKGGEGWVVIEDSTGLSIGNGKTQADAIMDAKAKITKAGAQKFYSMVQKAQSNIPKPTLAEPTPAPPAAAEKGMPLKQSFGGAVPSELEGNESFVSNMFAAIDRDRVAMGKPPMAETRPRTWDEDNQRALAQMNRDPKWIPELLDRMEKSPRPLLSWENAGVVWQRALWKTEYNNALQRIASAFDDKREADLSAAKTDAAVFEDKLERLDRIVGRNGTGSEAGRTLQAQKMGAGDDFTLVEMTLQKRASVGGRRLTPEETARIQKDVERLNALNAALQKSLADADAARLKAETDRAMAELRLSKAPTFDQRILSAAESIVVKMERAAEPAAARLRERLMRMSAGVDPTIIYDAALVGSARIARLGLDLAKFTDSMVKDFSEKIRPMIPEIWKAANDMLDAVKAPEPVKRAIRKTDLASVKTDVTRAIQEKLADKELSKIRFEINKLAKAFWQSGIRDREAMVDALYDTVGEVTGMTRRQVAEAFAGYGDYRQLSKDRMSVDLRGMKGELQQIAKLEAMQRGEPPLKSGLERRTPTEAERQLIKLVNDAKNKFQVPVQDPNTQLKSALDTLKTTLANRIKDYEGRLAKKDFAPRPRREVQLDAEAVRLRAQAEYIKKRWRQELLADRMKNRTLWEKIMDWGTKYRRFTALSSPVVIPKLIAAAGWRAASTLAEDISGGGLSLVPGIRQISQRAPLEGYGGQLRATMRGYGAAFTKGLEDAARVARTGHSDIDVLYGKAGESYTGESEMASVLLSFPGRLHGVIKAPVKRGAFEKATQRLGEFYARQGLDVTSEPVKLRIALEAYKAGNRAIFLQDNRMASAFNSALAALERKGETGHAAPGGKAMATAARFMFPVTRVPVNIAAETLQYGAGSVTGSVRAVKAIRNGLDTLTPDQADLITRELKKGSVGLAALYLGYMGYQHIGGVYEQGKKPKPGEIKPGAVRMFGVDIPENLLHHPVMNTIQLGATVHKTALEKLRRKDPDAQGIPAGVLAAAWGLADEVPFIQGPHRLFGGLASPSTRQKTVGIELGSVTIPQAVAWTAQVLDQRRETPPANLYQRIMGPPAKLKPATIPQYLETRIPGLRQNVPLAPPQTAPLNFKQILQNQ